MSTLKNSKPALITSRKTDQNIFAEDTLSYLEEKYAYLVERLALKRSNQFAYAQAYVN